MVLTKAEPFVKLDMTLRLNMRTICKSSLGKARQDGGARSPPPPARRQIMRVRRIIRSSLSTGLAESRPHSRAPLVNTILHLSLTHPSPSNSSSYFNVVSPISCTRVHASNELFSRLKCYLLPHQKVLTSIFPVLTISYPNMENSSFDA